MEGASTTDKLVSDLKNLKPGDIEARLTEVVSFLKPAEDANVPEVIHHFRKEFSDLLDEAKIEQLVVLIDDLDRCLPATAIETLEAIRLFLFVPKTAFVIGADEGMIEYASILFETSSEQMRVMINQNASRVAAFAGLLDA